MNTYQWLASTAPMAGLFIFIALFALAAFHALRPGNKSSFDAAATIPLQED